MEVYRSCSNSFGSDKSIEHQHQWLLVNLSPRWNIATHEMEGPGSNLKSWNSHDTFCQGAFQGLVRQVDMEIYILGRQRKDTCLFNDHCHYPVVLLPWFVRGRCLEFRVRLCHSAIRLSKNILGLHRWHVNSTEGIPFDFLRITFLCNHNM